MKICVEADEKNINISVPRWVYMNSVGISLIAMRKDVPFTPKQGRKAVREIKRAMREHDISAIAEIDVEAQESKVHIEV